MFGDLNLSIHMILQFQHLTFPSATSQSMKRQAAISMAQQEKDTPSSPPSCKLFQVQLPSGCIGPKVLVAKSGLVSFIAQMKCEFNDQSLWQRQKPLNLQEMLLPSLPACPRCCRPPAWPPAAPSYAPPTSLGRGAARGGVGWNAGRNSQCLDKCLNIINFLTFQTFNGEIIIHKLEKYSDIFCATQPDTFWKPSS